MIEHPTKPANAAKKVVFLAALLITSICLFTPISPQMPKEGLDPSWVFGTNQAAAMRLAFGQQIIFTFGPYSAIYTQGFHPEIDSLMIVGGVILSLSFFFAAALNLKNSSWPVQLIFIGLLAIITTSKDALLFLYPLLVGFYVFRTPSFASEDRGRAGFSDTLVLSTLFAPFGLLPLIKGSLLAACAAAALASSVYLLKSRRAAQAFLVWVSPTVASLFFWILAGQDPLNLASYFLSMVPLISGYTQAMSEEGDSIEVALYSATALTLLFTTIRNTTAKIDAKILLVLLLGSCLFLSLKAGFVRHDAHAAAASTMIVLTTLLCSTLLHHSRPLLPVYFLALTTWAVIDGAHIKTSTSQVGRNIRDTYSRPWNGLINRIKDPDALHKEFELTIKKISESSGFPKLPGTADNYSHDQTSLIASGTQWNPRPIFQSYSAYMPDLLRKNNEHLQKSSRPDYVTLAVQPIDGRLPALEDGISWHALLDFYNPKEFLKNQLLLEKKSEGKISPSELRQLSSNNYKIGERIDLPSARGPIFAKLDLENSLAGKISGLIYKTSELKIKLTVDGNEKSFRFIANMGRSEFLLTPLVEKTSDFGLLFFGEDFLNDKRVSSIEIEAPKQRWQWKHDFRLELYTLDRVRIDDLPNLYNFSRPTTDIESGASEKSSHCDGFIDFLNGAPPPADMVQVGRALKINGWLAKSIESGIPATEVFFKLTARDGSRLFLKAGHMPRPDVGDYLKKPTLSAAGYALVSDVSSVVGDYTIEMAYLDNYQLNVCSNYRLNARFLGD